MDNEFENDDGGNYEWVSIDLPIDVYVALVEIAGSEDEKEMSKVVNRILAEEIKKSNIQNNSEDQDNE